MADQGMGHRQRLKERFLAGEPSGQSDEAILELILTYAIPRIDVQPLARRLIAQFGSLRAVLAADRRELARVHGMGDAAITLLKLADHMIATLNSPSTLPSAPDPLPAYGSGAGATSNTEAWGHGEDERAASSAVRSEAPEARGDLTPPSALVLPPSAAVSPATVDPPPAATPAPSRPRAFRAKPAPASARPAPDAPATRWRATGRYSAANMLKPGLVAEIRIALGAYARLGDLAATRRYLQEEGLSQRSRATRDTIVTVIGERLASWNPPRWVCADLIAASGASDPAALKLLLLLHTARQDALLYAVVQEVVAPRQRTGLTAISHIEMQRFLDEATPTHPEIHTWSRATRIKLAGNLLTVLRDYGLLAAKRIVEPVVSPSAAGHLARLLAEEGVAPEQIADHPDWALWLITPERARALLAAWDGGAP